MTIRSGQAEKLAASLTPKSSGGDGEGEGGEGGGEGGGGGGGDAF